MSTAQDVIVLSSSSASPERDGPPSLAASPAIPDSFADYVQYPRSSSSDAGHEVTIKHESTDDVVIDQLAASGRAPVHDAGDAHQDGQQPSSSPPLELELDSSPTSVHRRTTTATSDYAHDDHLAQVDLPGHESKTPSPASDEAAHAQQDDHVHDGPGEAYTASSPTSLDELLEEAQESTQWSGDLRDQMKTFDIENKAVGPIKNFNRANIHFLKDLVAEFHDVLLEIYVWSNHRIRTQREAAQSSLRTSMVEIQAEEAKQDETRLRLLAFMTSIQRAIEGLQGMPALTGVAESEGDHEYAA